MNNRDFLQDITIWGAILVARCGKMLHYSIPDLLKYCDKILLMQDNIDEKTKDIVESYKRKYPDIIELAESGFPRATEKQEKEPGGLFRRFKRIQGPVRQTVLDYLYKKVDEGEKIDMVIWIDSDEVMSDHFPEILKIFWNSKDKQSLVMKPIQPYMDWTTILGRSMTGHGRCWKLGPKKLIANPYRTACNLRPLVKADRMGCKYYLIHLCHIKSEKFNWRMEHWKKDIRSQWGLWKLLKDIRRMHPKEIKEVLTRPPDFTVEEYLRGGEKRLPMGVDNAKKALREATDILDQLGVRYFLGFGTALGIYRDGAIISHDWDLDTIILGEDNEKLEQGKQKILEAGFTEFKRKQDIPKWIKPDGTKSEEKYVRTYSFHKYGARIDLDPAYLSADGQSRIILKGRKREMFCGKHPAKWFDDHGGVEYDGKFYRIPTPIEDYLASNYGDGWKTPVYSLTRWQKRPCFSQYYECQ